MIHLTALWLPSVVSAVVVFVASAVMHMVLPFHRKDYQQLPDEDKIREVMRAAKVQVGNYMFPHAKDMKEAQSPEMVAKFEEGPVALVNILPSGPPTMGKALGIWFVFCLVVSVFVAYLTSRTLGPGTHYLSVFRIAGAVGFMGYGMSDCTNSIWRGQSWGTTVRNLVDALIYGLLTAGVFGWLWPD